MRATVFGILAMVELVVGGGCTFTHDNTADPVKADSREVAPSPSLTPQSSSGGAPAEEQPFPPEDDDGGRTEGQAK